jgi:hypothetical protein
MDDALGNALPVEACELLDDVKVFQEDAVIAAGGLEMLIVADRRTTVLGQRWHVGRSFFCRVGFTAGERSEGDMVPTCGPLLCVNRESRASEVTGKPSIASAAPSDRGIGASRQRFHRLVPESKASGVEPVEFRLPQIARVRTGAVGRKDPVVLVPDDQSGRFTTSRRPESAWRSPSAPARRHPRSPSTSSFRPTTARYCRRAVRW